MKRIILVLGLALSLSQAAQAATAVNLDSETRTITVTEGGNRTDIALGAGESAEFCPDGCFVTMPNGDREALTGAEAIEISGGVAHIK